MNDIYISLSDIMKYIWDFFRQFLSKFYLTWTFANGTTKEINLPNLFIGCMLFGRIIGVFFGKYNDYDNDMFSTDDLYDE